MKACTRRLGQILKELNHSHFDTNVRNEGAEGFDFLLSQSTFHSLKYNHVFKHFCHWTSSRDGIINK
jgi:hypothetical protein